MIQRLRYTLFLLLAFCSEAFCQTPAPAVAISNLPQYVIGFGPSWTRGGTSPYSVDAVLAIHVGQTQWYSWTNISTPFTLPVVPGAPPVASSITTGGAWIPVQSASGTVSLVVIVQAGFSMIQATSTASPQFTGSAGLAFRVRPHVYVMPYAKASNASTTVSSGALATAVFQPGVQVFYGFGGK